LAAHLIVDSLLNEFDEGIVTAAGLAPLRKVAVLENLMQAQADL
jgi:hypothetical protein